MKHWESVLVTPKTSLEDAITILDQGALRIAIVVDEERRLLGTLTDGDVRRALLRHQPLDIAVSQVMCATPQVAQRDWSRERVLAVMESTQLLQLPVVPRQDAADALGLAITHAHASPSMNKLAAQGVLNRKTHGMFRSGRSH